MTLGLSWPLPSAWRRISCGLPCASQRRSRTLSVRESPWRCSSGTVRVPGASGVFLSAPVCLLPCVRGVVPGGVRTLPCLGMWTFWCRGSAATPRLVQPLRAQCYSKGTPDWASPADVHWSDCLPHFAFSRRKFLARPRAHLRVATTWSVPRCPSGHSVGTG